MLPTNKIKCKTIYCFVLIDGFYISHPIFAKIYYTRKFSFELPQALFPLILDWKTSPFPSTIPNHLRIYSIFGISTFLFEVFLL